MAASIFFELALRSTSSNVVTILYKWGGQVIGKVAMVPSFKYV